MKGKRKLSFEETCSDDDCADDQRAACGIGVGVSLRTATVARFRTEVKNRRRDSRALDIGRTQTSMTLAVAGSAPIVSNACVVEAVIGSHAAQGRRETMEDVIADHICLGNMQLTGVFDGHNGARTAAFLGQRLLPEVAARLASRRPQGNHCDEEKTRQALVDAFKAVESELLQIAGSKHFNDGSTACVLSVLGGRFLVCANCGDTRALLVTRGGDMERLSVDHRVEGVEKERIEAAGGDVRFHTAASCWRIVVDHMALMVSRSFGDLQFKHGSKLPRGEALLLCTPHVMVRAMRPEYEAVVLASDGLWDVLSESRVVAIVLETVRACQTSRSTSSSDNGADGSLRWTEDLARSCAQTLVNQASLAQTRDNVSVVVVGFQRDSPK